MNDDDETTEHRRLADAVDRLTRERDEARAEVERLRGKLRRLVFATSAEIASAIRGGDDE